MTATPQLKSLTITPLSFNLTGAGSTQTLSVSGGYSDNSTKDLTLGSTGTTYSSSNPRIAAVSSDGVVTAIASGSVTVTAINGKITATVHGELVVCTDTDGDGFATQGSVCGAVDCDDHDPDIKPGAIEVCNGKDDNCNRSIDEGFDQDGDGVTSCAGDCDDTQANIYPGASEICGNGIDEDCDGKDLSCDDVDNDKDGYTKNQSDCNDHNPAVHPKAAEVCDGLDNNCDGEIDESVQSTCYEDKDSDGYGNPARSLQACQPPKGYVANSADCDDSKGDIHPGAVEVCDSQDNDCDGKVDEDVQYTLYYEDKDNDGYGNPASSVRACLKPSGYVIDSKDCNDDNAGVHPGATEICGDGIDQDCNGKDPRCCKDADGDGFAVEGGECGLVDCDDSKVGRHPGATEICGDGIDQDCNPYSGNHSIIV